MLVDRDKEKEVVFLFENAKKAAAAAESEGEGGPEETRCLDALSQLKVFPVTVQLLVSTQIGKNLRFLTKHANKNIKDVASEVVMVWKRMVLEQQSNRKDATVVEDETGKEDRVEKLRKITSSNTKLKSLPRCSIAWRDRLREQLYQTFCKVSSEANDEIRDAVNSCDPMQVAVDVESAMFEHWGSSDGSNKVKYRSVMFNIRDSKNPDFRRRILLGQVKPERIVEMSSEEMASDEMQEKNQQIKEKALLHCELESAPKATTDQFKCGRCGERKTTYYQMQTRSADEPMTTYVTCINCNNHWKFC